MTSAVTYSVAHAFALSTHGVEELQEVVRCEFDFLVAPLRSSVMASNQPRSMEAAKVAVDERVPGFRLVRSAFRQAEVPLAVLLPRVRLEERVFVLCCRLDISPIATKHVLAALDELLGASDRPLVDGVRGQGPRNSRSEPAGWPATLRSPVITAHHADCRELRVVAP
jgi:hypothetical protein